MQAVWAEGSTRAGRLETPHFECGVLSICRRCQTLRVHAKDQILAGLLIYSGSRRGLRTYVNRNRCKSLNLVAEVAAFRINQQALAISATTMRYWPNMMTWFRCKVPRPGRPILM